MIVKDFVKATLTLCNSVVIIPNSVALSTNGFKRLIQDHYADKTKFVVTKKVVNVAIKLKRDKNLFTQVPMVNTTPVQNAYMAKTTGSLD